MNELFFEIYDAHSNDYDEKDSTWRSWVVELDADKSLHTFDRTERDFEMWMRRLARAKGERYIEEGLNRKWKRKGWLKAKEYFEKLEEDRKVQTTMSNPGWAWASVEWVISWWLSLNYCWEYCSFGQ